MEKQVPNQHLADRIAGKVDLNGVSLVKVAEEIKEEVKQVAKVVKQVAKAKKK